jgi:hypothetical protein
MEGRLVVLARVLEQFDLKAPESDRDRREMIHDAIYLAQLAGVDLGYGFSWSNAKPGDKRGNIT